MLPDWESTPPSPSGGPRGGGVTRGGADNVDRYRQDSGRAASCRNKGDNDLVSFLTRDVLVQAAHENKGLTHREFLQNNATCLKRKPLVLKPFV